MMNDYLHLLLAFHALPRDKRRTTMMEVAGYPHYENVCSNILSFYFNPAGEHGLGDLLLAAFLRMAGEPSVRTPATLNIEREHPAEDDKRIDLVLDCESFTIGIENKIYHWEANDLENYARVIETLGAGKLIQPIKAILCLNTSPAQHPAKGGFVRYTYAQLWSYVRDLLGQRLGKADPKWLLHLNDFMETTSRLAGMTQEESQFTDFYTQHREVIERLVADRTQLINRLATCVRNIEARVANMEGTTNYLIKRWIWQTHTLASHFKINGETIGMDLGAGLHGWVLTLFQLTTGNRNVLRQLRKSQSISDAFSTGAIVQDRYHLKKWGLNATEEELQEALITGLRALIAAADELTTQP